MCGITGFVCAADPDTWLTDLPQAVASLHHRGPDDQGTWIEGPAALGFTRLSIIDLSAAGHQPMVSADGSLVMVLNGEVYNYRELRVELEALGCRFRGHSDTEVALAAFERWGIDAVQRFVGMYAIALWNRTRKRLTLLRDRLGVKPLYYGWDGHTLWFGSELKALRAYRGWSPGIEPDALRDYLQFGYIAAPRSIYRGVCKLPPGHLLEHAPGRPPAVRRYWSLRETARPIDARDEVEVRERLQALLIDAFRLRMRSDVPVGVFLSGGIDSSLVAALLQRHGGGRIETYTIGFDEPRFDEAPYAAKVAEALGTVHHERTLAVEDALQIVPRWAELYDEPFADTSGIATYLVSRVAAEHVKVVLSADGGDELFGGYSAYPSTERRIRMLEAWPGALRRGTGRMLGSIDPQSPAIERAVSLLPAGAAAALRSGVADRWSRASNYLRARNRAGIYEEAIGLWPAQAVAGLLGAGPRLRTPLDDYPGTILAQMRQWDLDHYLPGDILTKVDRATMAASIEGRDPLLDHRVVEFAFGLPDALLLGPLGSKHILRDLLYRLVPRAIVDRPKKGFAVPIERWLRGKLAPLIDELLDPKRIAAQGIFDPAPVAQAVQRLRVGAPRAAMRVWSLLAFQLWSQRWA